MNDSPTIDQQLENDRELGSKGVGCRKNKIIEKY